MGLETVLLWAAAGVAAGVFLWLVLELVSSIISRKYVADANFAYLNELATAINTILQTGATERAEFLRLMQVETQATWQTIRTAVALDLLTDMVSKLQRFGEGEK